MPHQSIALYNRKGERLISLKDAEIKGYGSVITIKQRIRRGQIIGYKIGPLWLVLQQSLPRPAKRRRP